ncbi:MAG: IPT/TIG domain-containing protein, partial [Bdellovibrionota bacterium]
ASSVTVDIPGTDFLGKTDAAGKITLSDLPPGVWNVRAELAGYSSSTVTGVVVESGKTTQSDTLFIIVDTGVAGTVAFNGGAKWSTDLNVKVQLITNSGATLYKLSEDPLFVNVQWAPVVASVPWKFTSYGTKILYAQFANANGLSSSPITATIEVNAPPTLSAITLPGGPLAGGNTVALTGTWFLAAPTITVGGKACTSATTVATTSATCVVPALAAGTYDVVFTNYDSQSVTLTGAYTSRAAPTLTSATPIAGPLGGGGPITLLGSGFVSGATASVGGSPCTNPTFVDAGTLTCTLPPIAASTAAAVITNPDLQTATLAGAYTYQPSPSVASFSPSYLPLAGGATFTLSGSGFLTGATVSIGGSACTSTSILSTQVTCAAPANSSGAKAVVITNTDGQTGTANQSVTYATPSLTSVTPSFGITRGGTVVTLVGSGL